MRSFSFLVFARVDDCGTTGRIAVRLEGMEKGIDRDAAHHVARSCHIVSLYTHMQCWALLVRASYFAARQIKELEFIVRLEASLLSGAGVEEDRSQDYRTADEAGTTLRLVKVMGDGLLLGEPDGRYFSKSHQAHGNRIYRWTEGRSAFAVDATALLFFTWCAAFQRD